MANWGSEFLFFLIGLVECAHGYQALREGDEGSLVMSAIVGLAALLGLIHRWDRRRRARRRGGR